MTLKTCNKCGVTKPLRCFYKNGKGRYRTACSACERKTADLTASKRRAVEMWNAGMRIRVIARAFGRNERTISYWLQAAGIETRARSNASMGGRHRGDQTASEPIGAAGGKWAELDASIMRDRLAAGMVDGRRRVQADPWPTQTSLA